MTSFDIHRGTLPTTVDRMASGGSFGGKASYVARNPTELLNNVENIAGRSEEATRIQQYLGAKEEAMARGLTEEQAKLIGSRAARENTVNFGRFGEYGPVLNALIPYYGSGVQGSRLTIRHLK